MTTATRERKRTKVKLRPLADRVVVERDEAEERTAGGIVLPDKAKEKINRGKVIAVGVGKLTDKGKRVPLQVRPGDHVLFSKYGGDDLKVDDDEWLLIRESDILAVIV